MNECKDCKSFIDYKWSFPYGGSVEIESKRACRHPDNSDKEKSHYVLNEGGKCTWFEAGKHKNNCAGEYRPGKSPEEEYPHLFTKQHAKDMQWVYRKLMQICGVKALFGR